MKPREIYSEKCSRKNSKKWETFEMQIDYVHKGRMLKTPPLIPRTYISLSSNIDLTEGQYCFKIETRHANWTYLSSVLGKPKKTYR